MERGGTGPGPHGAAVRVQALARGWLARRRVAAILAVFQDELQDEDVTFLEVWDRLEIALSPRPREAVAGLLEWPGRAVEVEEEPLPFETAQHGAYWLLMAASNEEGPPSPTAGRRHAAATAVQRVWRGRRVRVQLWRHFRRRWRPRYFRQVLLPAVLC
eukprot:EG_transcript_34301